ncbi:MAG TPA: ABC transporter permease [Acidimicrobiia bacterium]|jgi:lipooligosaccharide transport system permease protein|nr:ABC transporter permease [Acidimicrobiia bacterium]
MTTGTFWPRVMPLRFATKRAATLVERNLLVYRQVWGVLVSGFFEPVFYLFSVTIGLGQLVGDITMPDGSTVSYAAFVAPALLGASAMNGPVFESFGIFFKLKYAKIYDGVLATPVTPQEIAVGEITWSQIRGALYSAAFLVVMGIMGLIESWWGLLALPAAMLVGLAFGAVGMAATTYMRSWQDFDLVSLATMPMFLFSATFYPLDIYPEWLQTVARLSPLYHAVELIRAFTLGIIDSSIVGHVAFLLVMVFAGLAVAGRRIEALLLK